MPEQVSHHFFRNNQLNILTSLRQQGDQLPLVGWVVTSVCTTLCDPIDGSPPGSPVPGILQERILEWVAISFSNA